MKPTRESALSRLPAPLTYRTAKVGWTAIALEFAGALAAIAFAGHQLPEGLRVSHAALLALVLLTVPFWHLFLKSCGHVTFVLEGNNLLISHFPFSARNHQIPLADIRNVQVSAEMNDDGKLTHYSLLLVRRQAQTDRLVDHLPSADLARALAQQLEALIRIGTARAH